MFTHENPLMDGFNKIDFYSIELREAEKKEMIHFVEAEERAIQLVRANSEVQTLKIIT
jgi:hypothetical protein